MLLTHPSVLFRESVGVLIEIEPVAEISVRQNARQEISVRIKTGRVGLAIAVRRHSDNAVGKRAAAGEKDRAGIAAHTAQIKAALPAMVGRLRKAAVHT
jgi:hypothetical protein